MDVDPRVNVLVANVGSSTVKLSVVAADDTIIESQQLDTSDRVDAIEAFVAGAGEYGAIGHRVVHGGTRFTSATVIDEATLAELDRVSDLAPLHNPPAVRVIRLLAHRDSRPNVACFDTAFHTTMPEEARTYAIPSHWRDKLGIRRFGFHGLSHAWASGQATKMLDAEPADLRLVICHLGAGASLAAVRGGRCIDTTMGFTPVEGLIMARRSGDVDPGALAWMVARGHVAPVALEELLNQESGLFALAGTDDMREVLAREQTGDVDAELALRIYVHRLVKGIGAMTASLGGVDAIVFTGGIGEGASHLRALACQRLVHLGTDLDSARNQTADTDTDTDVSASGAAVRTLVVHAREDLEIARQVRSLGETRRWHLA